MKAFNPEDISADALAKAGWSPELLSFLTLLGAFGEKPELCDCPPGLCLGEGSGFPDFLTAQFDPGLARDSGDETDPADEDDEDEDELEVVFEPDFDFDPIEMSQDDKIEAVAQLGRIIEGLTTVVEIHAALLTELVAQ
jgi:hypothetical protein